MQPAFLRLVLEVLEHVRAHAAAALAWVDDQRNLGVAPRRVHPTVTDRPALGLDAPPVAAEHRALTTALTPKGRPGKLGTERPRVGIANEPRLVRVPIRGRLMDPPQGFQIWRQGGAAP